MSRAITQVVKVVPSLSGSSSMSAPLAPRSPFSTSAPLDKRQSHSGKKASSSSLVMPDCSQPSKIKYGYFVDSFRQNNPKLKEVTQAEIQRALRQYFVSFFGREDFEDIRKQCRSPPETDKDKAAWARLCDEGQQYWKRR